MITIDIAIKRCIEKAYYERIHGNLQGCLEFRQIAVWLEQLQKIQEIHKKWFCDYTSAEAYTKISEVLNGNDD